MSERARFEEWLLSRDYHRSQIDEDNGVYRDPVAQVQWNVWQARAQIAADEKRELVEALDFAITAFDIANDEFEAETMKRIGDLRFPVPKNSAAHSLEDCRTILAKHKERTDES